MEVTRLAVGVQVETHYEGRQAARRLWLQFVSARGEPEERTAAGLGFIHYVDALQVQAAPSDLARCQALPQWPALLQALRPEYFRARLRTHALARQMQLSHFEREWLWLLDCAMLATQAVSAQTGLAQATREVRRSRVEHAEQAMKIFRRSRPRTWARRKWGVRTKSCAS